MNGFDELVGIVARLRSEGGCEWDRAQTPESLRPYVLEEAYEVLDAIDRGDTSDLRKELGDVLFQLVLLSRMAEEADQFDMAQVLASINAKMVRRHPHVFEADHSEDNPQGIAAWEARKARERGTEQSALDGVPTALPALLRAHRISEKAGRVGFDWPDVAGVRAKVDEELRELDDALEGGDPGHIAEEYGDLLFTLVNLGRHLPVGAETALRAATTKFSTRFRALERSLVDDGSSVHDASDAHLEARWQTIKGGG